MTATAATQSRKEVSDRLAKARALAGYRNWREAADALGFEVLTYKAHETGVRGLRPDVAERYAAAFGVSVTWLLYGRGSMRAVGASPCIAQVVALMEMLPEAEQRKVLGFVEAVAAGVAA